MLDFSENPGASLRGATDHHSVGAGILQHLSCFLRIGDIPVRDHRYGYRLFHTANRLVLRRSLVSAGAGAPVDGKRLYPRLLGDPRFDRDQVAHMRLFVSGSAPLLAETHVEFEQRTGHRILERYGMTETNAQGASATGRAFHDKRGTAAYRIRVAGVLARRAMATSW